MKNIVIALLILLIGSCSVTNLYKQINYGEYIFHSLGYAGVIIIYKDGTFEFTKRTPGRKATCKGKWKIISKNMIVIDGKDVANYYGNDSLFFNKFDIDHDTIIFVKPNKIKYKGLIYKKFSAKKD